jgi:hypothetical protein
MFGTAYKSQVIINVACSNMSHTLNNAMKKKTPCIILHLLIDIIFIKLRNTRAIALMTSVLRSLCENGTSCWMNKQVETFQQTANSIHTNESTVSAYSLVKRFRYPLEPVLNAQVQSVKVSILICLSNSCFTVMWTIISAASGFVSLYLNLLKAQHKHSFSSH